MTKRILVIEDEPQMLLGLRDNLELEGYEVVTAADGEEGLSKAISSSPDLVILDMMMPKRSGFLVLEKLRRTRESSTKVIMITANEGSRHKAYAEMLGVDEYLRKPFAMDKLLDAVQRQLG